ncbi:MAG: hypothetical protein V7756_12865 [Halopseudomonas sp.]|uniref:hypothetical protein n=1 Tax=Halopseudomonas sp. TaxID=2901191 RepID=UPI00300152A0
MAKSGAERMRALRARQKLRDSERAERLTAFTLNMPVYQGTADCMERIKSVAGIDENADLVTRAIHNISKLPDEALREIMKNP